MPDMDVRWRRKMVRRGYLWPDKNRVTFYISGRYIFSLGIRIRPAPPGCRVAEPITRFRIPV